MDYQWVIPAVLYVLVVIPLIGYFYGRQKRWLGAAGWLLLLGGQVMLQGGAGGWFAWGGLLWMAVSGFGLILAVIDVRRR